MATSIFNLPGAPGRSAGYERAAAAFGNFSEPSDEEKKKIRQQRVAKATPRKQRQRLINEGLNRGMSWEQISQDTGIPLQSVKNYSQRTRPDYGIDKRNIVQKATDVAKNLYVDPYVQLGKEVTGYNKKQEELFTKQNQEITRRRRAIRESTVLSPEYKKQADEALRATQEKLQAGFSGQVRSDVQDLENITGNPLLRGGAAGGAGVLRSVQGVAQGAGGLFDLATPGRGQSRLTQVATRGAEATDQFVEDQELSQAAYKGGQLTGEALQLLAGGELAKVAQAALKGGKTLKLGKDITAATRAAEVLDRAGVVGKITKTAGGYILKPTRVANIAGNVAVDQGQLSARGEDISPKSIGISTAANYALGGVLDATSAGLTRLAKNKSNKISVFSGGDGKTGWATENKDFAGQFADTPGSKLRKTTINAKDVLDTRIPEQRAKLDAVLGKDKVDELISRGDTGLPVHAQRGEQDEIIQAAKDLGYKHVALSETDKLTKFGGQDVVSYADTTKALEVTTPKQVSETIAKTSQKAEAVAKRTGTPTSRVKQFYKQADKDILSDIESSTTAGTGQRQAVTETYKTAVARGPINLENVKVGDKIDAVDVARARMTMGTYLDDAQKAIKTGDAKAIAKSKGELDKALEGYRILTGEAGRATQIQSTFDNKAVKAFEAIADYQKTITDGQVPTRGQIKYMDDLMNDLMEEAQTSRVDGIKEALITGDTSLIRKLEEYATSAKLTSPTTHIRNIVGNTLTFGQRALEQSVATGIGAARGRTSIRALGSTFGTRSGYKEATQKFVGILNDAVHLRKTSENLAAGEGFKDAIGGRFGEFVRIPFKFLEAADEFGKTILRDSKLHQEAYDLAYREGARGEILKDRVAQLIQNPTKKMLSAAQKDALEYTFQKDLGKVSGGFQKIVSNIPGGKFFAPFIKTPTNVIKFQLSRSVAGAPGQLIQGVVKRGTREGDEAIARAITGTLLSLGTYNWVRDNSDRITGAAPTKQSEKDAFYASGKQAYAIKVGNRWVSYQSFQPVGMYLLQAKSLADAIDKNDEKGAIAIASSMAQVAAKGMLELPFVQGMNNIVEVLSAGEDYAGGFQDKAEKFVTDTVRGFVPSGLNDIRRYTDEIVRSPKNLKESIYDMIPGLSEQVSPRRNVLGENATRKDSPLARSLFRVFGTQEQPTPEEFKVLQGVAKNADYTVSAPGRTQRGKKLSDSDYEAYQKAYYDRFRRGLESAMNDGGFQRKSWDGKRKVIERIVRKAGDATRNEFFGKK